jgi:hypothetical protein
MAALVNNKNYTTELEIGLANYLLAAAVGSQLLSTRELADQFGASLGSISAAVNQLEEIGAVTINRRGRLGSFLEQKSIGKLWNTIENRPLVIALTLPSFPKCEGLATGIYTLLNNAGIEIYLIFIRGSNNRIKALRDGHCHAVVMSALAADELSGPGEEIVLRLPPQSFVTDHRVFYRNQEPDPSRPLRVGIDYDSFDIVYLTELEFAGQEVEFQEMTLMQIDRHMDKSFVDAAVSNLDHIERVFSREIASRPLSPRVQELLGDRDTSAAVIIPAGADPVRIVLKEVLDPDQLLEIQQKVVEGLIVPRY